MTSSSIVYKTPYGKLLPVRNRLGFTPLVGIDTSLGFGGPFAFDGALVPGTNTFVETVYELHAFKGRKRKSFLRDFVNTLAHRVEDNASRTLVKAARKIRERGPRGRGHGALMRTPVATDSPTESGHTPPVAP